jgi:hypothetical protein
MRISKILSLKQEDEGAISQEIFLVGSAFSQDVAPTKPLSERNGAGDHGCEGVGA